MLGRLVNVVVLGFVLSLDNFRTSVLLGPLRIRRARMLLVALNFGLWDGLAPLLGAGDRPPRRRRHRPRRRLRRAPRPARLRRVPAGAVLACPPADQDDEFDRTWTLFGLPLPLSVDNIVARTGLGLLGFSPWLPAIIFGVMTAVMSLIGPVLGRLAFRLLRNRINIRYELVTGIALIIEAIVLFFLAGGGDQP